ncbi:Hypp4078 [Branchiostoma lanceolatum]|uniref:Hypp4078 protein n=1 Tax=Branchiostoma lanceolatum TaxID=7740 RepID=A0A8K0A4C5_BRALA|nr:Hypp4078 [Branchiostoma lanceolatum]
MTSLFENNGGLRWCTFVTSGFQRQRQELTAERDLALARLQEAVQRASLAEQLASDAVRDREEVIGEKEKLTKERDYATRLYESLRRSVDVEDSDFPLSIRKTVDRQVQTYLSLAHGQGGAFNMMFGQAAGTDGISDVTSGNRRATKVVHKTSFTHGRSSVNNDGTGGTSNDCANVESSEKDNGMTSGTGGGQEEAVHPWLVSAGKGHGVRVMSPHPTEYKSMLRGNAQPKVMFRGFHGNAT